jgi:hypothetical protein
MASSSTVVSAAMVNIPKLMANTGWNFKGSTLKAYLSLHRNYDKKCDAIQAKKGHKEETHSNSWRVITLSYAKVWHTTVGCSSFSKKTTKRTFNPPANQCKRGEFCQDDWQELASLTTVNHAYVVFQ